MKIFKGPRRKLAIGVTAVAIVALSTGAAYALGVKLWGTGNASVSATQSQGLIVDNVKLTKPLVPGGTSGATGEVYNPNDFSAEVTGIIVLDEGQAVTGCAPAQHSTVVLSPSGTAVNAQVTTSTAPADLKPGKLFKLATPVTIPAKAKAPVALANIISQAPTATEFCGFDAKLAVEATTAGN